jgi:hypothetical protein
MMKKLLLLFSLFSPICVIAQKYDTVYIKSGKLFMQSAIDSSDRSLITIDGKIYKGTLETIAVLSIQEFDLLKPNAAITIFGKEGKNGAFMFKTVDIEKVKVSAERFNDLKKFVSANKPLIIVNHVPYKGDINSFNPTEITNVDILDKNHAVQQFGLSAKNGAVIISTSQKFDPLKGVFK